METSGGCGIIDHDTDCLCDVVIPHPTGWVDDAVSGMWMGHSITMLREYHEPWEPSTILDYLQDLVFAKDHWEEAIRSASGVAVFNPTDKWEANAREHIRIRLREMERPSIIQVRDEIGYDQDKLCHVLFQSRRYMDEEELQAFERSVLASKHTSPDGLANEFGMDYKAASRLHSYWGTPFRVRARNPVLDYMDELIEAMPDARPREIADKINERFGQGTIESKKVSHRKHTLSNK